MTDNDIESETIIELGEMKSRGVKRELSEFSRQKSRV